MCSVVNTRFPVEPVMLLYFLAMLSTLPIIQQFIYYHIGLSYGLPGVTFGNESLCDSKANSTYREAEQKAQQQSSQWMFYLGLACTIPALITIPLFGAFCDRVGRKSTLLVAIVSHMLYLINNLVVVYCDLDVQYLLIGSLALGFLGYYGAIGIGGTAFIADTIPRDQLSFRIAVLGGATGVAGIIANIGMGYWIRLSGGFFYPLLFPLGCQVLNLLYVLILLQETASSTFIAKQEKISDVFFSYLTKTFRLYIQGPNTCMLRIVIVSFFFTAMVDDSKSDVQALYQMNSPLCWNSIKIGYFNSITSFTFCILTMVAIKILSRWLKDVHMAMLACLFKMASLILEAFARTELLMYLVPVVACFAYAAPLHKSMLSKLVTTNEQGAVMSSVAFSEVLCALLGTLTFNNIYSATLAFLPGFVFLYMTALVFIGFVFLIVYWYIEKKAPSCGNMYEELPGTTVEK